MILNIEACDYIESIANDARQGIDDINLSKANKLKYDDVISYVEFYGGEVIKREGKNGEIVRNSNQDGFKIYANGDDIEEVVHELGHAFLSWDKIPMDTTGEALANSGTADAEEQAANYFVRAFLMPKEKFIDIVLKTTYNNICDFQLIANFFNVSKYAAVERGNDLRIWGK